jgi:hypothetical protein
MTSPGDQIRASNGGAQSWIDEVPRDGVPKTDKLASLYARDLPPFLFNIILISKEDPQSLEKCPFRPNSKFSHNSSSYF